jgi:hypothetical protein
MRAAAVGGGAYVVGKRRAGAEDEQAADQTQQAADQTEQDPGTGSPETAPSASSGGLSEDAITKLKEISALHASGVLTDEEFAQQKEKLLA